jgi:hypothetical protein
MHVTVRPLSQARWPRRPHCILADITQIRGVRAAATAPATSCHSCCEVVRHAASRVRWYSQSNNCAVVAAGLARPLPAISRAVPRTTAPWRDRYLHSTRARAPRRRRGPTLWANDGETSTLGSLAL